MSWPWPAVLCEPLHSEKVIYHCHAFVIYSSLFHMECFITIVIPWKLTLVFWMHRCFCLAFYIHYNSFFVLFFFFCECGSIQASRVEEFKYLVSWIFIIFRIIFESEKNEKEHVLLPISQAVMSLSPTATAKWSQYFSDFIIRWYLQGILTSV